MPKERIGIMGGSFNPIHDRHIEIAACARREEKLDRVIFLPTGNPPHKHGGLADAEYRFEMTRLAVSGIPGFTASRMEIDREGVIYTVDTLTRLQKQMPGADLFYLIGEDTLFDLPNWRRPDKVFTLCRFLVCSRETASLAEDPRVRALEERGARFTFLTLPPSPLSATRLRQALARGETPEGIRPQVMEYIRVMGLYGRSESPQGAAQWYPRLGQTLSDKRLVHSLLVAATARELASLHGVSVEQAAMAGLMHDCAKCMPLAQQQRIARESRLLVDKETLQSENLLHGPVGAVGRAGFRHPRPQCALGHPLPSHGLCRHAAAGHDRISGRQDRAVAPQLSGAGGGASAGPGGPGGGHALLAGEHAGLCALTKDLPAPADPARGGLAGAHRYESQP